MFWQIVHEVGRSEDSKGDAAVVKSLFDPPLRLIIQDGRVGFCSDKHSRNVGQMAHVRLCGQFHDAQCSKVLNPLDSFRARTCLEAKMHSYASTECLLHRITVFDTPLDVLEV